MKFYKLSFVILGSFIILIIAVISITKYYKNKAEIIENINYKLLLAAKTIPLIISDDFHDRAVSKESIPNIEDSLNIRKLSEFNNTFGLKFIYTVISLNDSLFITSSSATFEELSTGKEVRYFENYYDVCQPFKDSLKLLKTSFVFSTDRWGKYKTIIVPLKSPSGNLYFSCADIDIDNFNNILTIDLIEFLIDIAVIIALLTIFFIIFYQKIKKYNEKLKKEISCRELLENELKITQENLRNNLIEKTTELKKSETNFHTFFNNTDDLIIVIDNEGIIKEVNASTLEKTKFDYHELINKNLKDFQSEFFKFDIIEKIHQTSFIDNSSKLQTFPIVRKDGQLLYLDSKIRMGKWDDSEVIFLIARDNSQIKNFEEKFEVVFSSNPSPIAITEMQSNTLIDINEAFCKIFGYEAIDIVGKTFDELVLFFNPFQSRKILDTIFKVGKIENYEIDFVHKSGEKIIGNLNADIIEINNQKCLLIVINIITDRKKAEEQLVQKINQINALISSVPAFIFLKDKELKYIAFNEAFAKMLNRSNDDIIGKTDFDLFPEEIAKTRFEIEYKMISNKEHSYINEEYIECGNNGEFIWTLTNRKLFFDNYGEVRGLVGTIMDITKNKASETELAQFAEELKRSNKDLEQFAYIASHDLQEPLRKVIAFSQRLRTKYYDIVDETGKEYINRMESASERMQKMINDLLMFSRISTKANPFSQVDLNIVFENVLNDLEFIIKKSKAKIEISEKLPIIEADEIQLNQLFSNLIGNGIKYQSKENIPIIKIYHSVKDNNVEITLQDNGIGIDIQYKDIIFQPFQRLHGKGEYEGSGIGLAICKRIVERHKGNIDLQSTVGKGSKFIIVIPLKQNI